MLLLLLACTPAPPGLDRDPVGDLEDYLEAPVAVIGTVHDPSGAPLPDATVVIGDQRAQTGADGAFRLEDVTRINAWLSVTAPAHRPAERPVHLMAPLSQDAVDLGPIVLQSASAELARFVFFGDTMFGRRFLDPDDVTARDEVPTGDADALIHVDAPREGSARALSWVGPWLTEPDFTVVNLESPVLAQPDTPHRTKDYVFFTLPASVEALTAAGVDYASLGNNHVYDYLDAGIVDTLRYVSAGGLAHSGAGLDLDDAYAPHFVDAGTSTYALISASSIDGRKWDVHYNAEDDKGGAADLVDGDAFDDAMSFATLEGEIAIAQLHMGVEYTFSPSPAVRAHVARARDAGAALVVGHHPHTAQGFSWDGQTLAAYSLGNFVFDSERLETLLGLGLRVDLRGDALESAYALPVYVEDFRPRPAVGGLAHRLLRRIGETSWSDGVWVVPEAGIAWLATDADDVELVERTVRVPVIVDANRTAIVDVRQHGRPSESLWKATMDAPFAEATLGRDILLVGDMEDADIDDAVGELTRWDDSRDSVEGCMEAHSGVRGLCSTRDYKNLDPSVIALRQRVRVWGDADQAPIKDLSLVLYTLGDRAGQTEAYVRWMASEGEVSFGEQFVWTRESGSWPWTRSIVPLTMPPDVIDGAAPEANPRALRVFVRQQPPRERATGLLALDDVAVVAWGPEVLDLDAGAELPIPNQRDFLRIDAPPGAHTLELVFVEPRRRL